MAKICLKCKKLGWTYILVDWHRKSFLCWKCFKKIYPSKELREKVVDKTIKQMKKDWGKF